jgi:N-glycosylase/DNA lyase
MLIHLLDGTVEAPYTDFAMTLCDSGQAFRWKRGADGVAGVARGRVVRIRQSGDEASVDITKAEYDSYWMRYFALDDDYAPLEAAAEGDAFFARCLAFGRGLRVARQEFFESLVTFIVSARNNIPRIRGVLERLCEAYGARIDRDNFAFPTPERLAGLTATDVSEACGCGYRGAFILDAARLTAEGFFDGAGALPYDEQLARLMGCKGVGPKVANCVVLCALHNLAAFPIDVWMERIIQRAYRGSLDTAKFGSLAGMAQQYMFYYALKHKDEFR